MAGVYEATGACWFSTISLNTLELKRKRSVTGKAILTELILKESVQPPRQKKSKTVSARLATKSLSSAENLRLADFFFAIVLNLFAALVMDHMTVSFASFSTEHDRYHRLTAIVLDRCWISIANRLHEYQILRAKFFGKPRLICFLPFEIRYNQECKDFESEKAFKGVKMRHEEFLGPKKKTFDHVSI